MRLRTYNIVDYAAAVALIAIPFLFGFNEITVARNAFIVFGLVLFGYSLLTNYEYSLSKIIPMGLHMCLNFALGVAIYFAPYYLGYRLLLNMPQILIHMFTGLFMVGLIFFSRVKTEKDKFDRNFTT